MGCSNTSNAQDTVRRPDSLHDLKLQQSLTSSVIRNQSFKQMQTPIAEGGGTTRQKTLIGQQQPVDMIPQEYVRLEPDNTLFLECDVQETIRDHIQNDGETIIFNARRLTEIANILDIPIIATTHCKDKFGDVVQEITDVNCVNRRLFNKTTFSMIRPDSIKVLAEVERTIGRTNAVIYGAETHVAVKQTVMDLIEMGYVVYLVIDAVSSNDGLDHGTGLESMKQEGVKVTTVQSLAFELLKDSTHSNFKDIQAIAKEKPSNPILETGRSTKLADGVMKTGDTE